MGADSDMYSSAHYKNLSGVLYINWPSYKGEQSVAEVASRIIEEQKIKTDDVVGGSSLGGMVAAEIARQIKMNKLILIGSTLLPKYVNPALQKLSELSDIAPIKLIQILAGKVNISLEKPLLAMFSNADSQFIKAIAELSSSGKAMSYLHVKLLTFMEHKIKSFILPQLGQTL